MCFVAQILFLLFWASPGWAHMLADVQVQGQIEQKIVRAKMNISLHELKQWVPLPRDDKDHIVIRDLPHLRPQIQDYLARRMKLSVGDPAQDCTFFLDDFFIDNMSSINLSLRYQCPIEIVKIRLSSGLFVGSTHDYEMTWKLRKGTETFRLHVDRRYNKAFVDLAQVTTQKKPALIIIVSALGLLLLFAALALWEYWKGGKSGEV